MFRSCSNESFELHASFFYDNKFFRFAQCKVHSLLLNNKLPAHVTAVDDYALDGLIEYYSHLIKLNYFNELECQKLFSKMIPYLVKKELEFMKEEKCFPQRHHHKVIH